MGALGFVVDRADRPVMPRGEPVVLEGSALVRVHAAVDATDGRPLRHADSTRARLLAVAAGAGPVVVTAARVAGVLRATAARPALAYALAWCEVDDVGPAPSGGVRLLSTRYLGGLTLDLITS